MGCTLGSGRGSGGQGGRSLLSGPQNREVSGEKQPRHRGGPRAEPHRQTVHGGWGSSQPPPPTSSRCLFMGWGQLLQDGTPGESGGLGDGEVTPRTDAGSWHSETNRAPVPASSLFWGWPTSAFPNWGQRGVQPRGPEALEPCFWGPYPIRRAVSRGAGQTTDPPTHPPRHPLCPPLAPCRPLTAPHSPFACSAHRPQARKPEHHISFLFGTFRGLFTTSPGSSPGTAPAPHA